MVTAYRILGDDAMQSVVCRSNLLGWEFVHPVGKRPMEPAAAGWERSEHFIPDPSRRRGDIFDASSGNFACGLKVLDKIRDSIVRDCEILPIDIAGLNDQEYFLIHPITIIRALPPGLASSPRDLIMSFNAPKYEPSAFQRAALFRDPQQGSLSACVSGLGPEDLDFYVQYRRHGFTGLELRKIWEHPGAATNDRG